MGRGTETTLRIDEPLHFMFLVAYLITYFCISYLLFVCFKHCRRMWKRKPRSRPTRIRNVGELVQNFHARQRQVTNVRIPRHVQVSLHDNNTVCSEVIQFGGRNESLHHGGSGGGGDDESMTGSEDMETNTSRISPFLSPHTRFRPDLTRCVRDDLPSYDSISESEGRGELTPPPSYNDCVLYLPDNNSSSSKILVFQENSTTCSSKDSDEMDSSGDDKVDKKNILQDLTTSSIV